MASLETIATGSKKGKEGNVSPPPPPPGFVLFLEFVALFQGRWLDRPSVAVLDFFRSPPLELQGLVPRCLRPPRGLEQAHLEAGMAGAWDPQVFFLG